jgi:hypothetical protein
MTDFVVYHNEDKQGELGSKGDGVFRIWTTKPNPEQLLGHHKVWLVSGVGTPKRWSLRFWFIPSGIKDFPGGKTVYGEEGARAPSGGGVSLDKCDWFKRLYVARQLFSFGLQSLASKEGLLLVAEFEKVAKDWPRPGPAKVAPALSRVHSRKAAGAKSSPKAIKTLAMNIKREWFAAIVAGTKTVEYRSMSAFWKRRIEPLTLPFKMRLQNGMLPPVPEATIIVTKVSRVSGEYQLHLGKVLAVKHWDKGRQKPKA